jgi:hypothetical protein
MISLSRDTINPITTGPQNNNTSHCKQYLINQFFKVASSSSTRRINKQLQANINNNHSEHTIPNNLIQINNNIAINNNTLTPSNDTNSITTNDVPSIQQRTQKHYIQRHIMKKPIANDYWGSSIVGENSQTNLSEQFIGERNCRIIGKQN